MQDNYFFKEPTTQRKLLDILFIYAKLNPDTGYRQGMHELLAPVLWVINQDVINVATVKDTAKSKEGADFMLTVLDKRYIEHDTFNLFCAIMQTAKSFYEMGDTGDSSAIVAQSTRIHEELLAAVDPDLAHHLQVVGILPQIYSMYGWSDHQKTPLTFTVAGSGYSSAGNSTSKTASRFGMHCSPKTSLWKSST